MPANLTPDFKAAEQRYKEAKTTEEKIRALEEMLATIPKHKGTDHMQGDIKRRIAKVRAEGQKKGASKQTFSYYVEKEGAAQIFIIGPPNSGKSSLLARTTNSEPEIAPYPFTTRKALPGMMKYEDVPIQLVDTPPISHEFTESWLSSVVRNGEMTLLVIDVTAPDPISDIEMVREILGRSKIRLVGKSGGMVEVEPGWVALLTVLLCNKMDLDPGREHFGLIEELYGKDYSMLGVSCETQEGLQELRRLVYDKLDIIRVYPKTPGKPPDFDSPIILKKGSDLMDFAKNIHKDFIEKLKFARIWGEGKYDGQRVPKDYIIQDKDIIEIHV